MDNLLLIIILIFGGQTLGCLAGLVKAPKNTVLYGSLAFAASMMLGISFLELLPESLKIISFPVMTASFFLGVIVMLSVDKILPHINPELLKKEKPSVKRGVTMLVIGIALHNIPEGLAIGVGFALTPALGITIAIGIATQDVPENIATIVPLYALTGKRLKSFIIVAITILFELLGFILGYYVLKETTELILGASLAVAAGFMTYISVEELIPAASIKQYPGVGITGLVLGIVIVILLGLI